MVNGGQMVVHPGGQTAGAIALHGIRSQRDDRHAVTTSRRTLLPTNGGGGGEPSISGIWQSIRMRSNRSVARTSSAETPIFDGKHRVPEEVQHPGGDLAVDGVSSTKSRRGLRELAVTGSGATGSEWRVGTRGPVRNRPSMACCSKAFRTGLVTQPSTSGTPDAPASYPTDVSISMGSEASCGSARDCLRQLQSVHVRHLKIQDGQLKRLGRCGGSKLHKRVAGGCGQLRNGSPGAEMIVQDLAIGGGVIDDQNPSLEQCMFRVVVFGGWRLSLKDGGKPKVDPWPT